MAQYLIVNRSIRSRSIKIGSWTLEFDALGQTTTDSKELVDIINANLLSAGYSIVSQEEAEKARKAAEARAAELAEFKKTLNPALKGKLNKQLRELKEAWGNEEDASKRSEIEEKIKDLEEKLS